MNQRLAVLSWGALTACAWLAYAPGLTGGFVFDDFINLPALGASGPIDDTEAFWRYITSGTADPVGRPLSLLTFLLDARDWPADPRPFLRTNILLHLLNGALLWQLLRRLGRGRVGSPPQNEFAAVLGAGVWLLHPLLVSTTLYIVQREAMLPATFTLIALIGWVHGRERAAQAPLLGLIWMSLALGIGTLLAFLSKANGALVPMLALVLDATILRDLQAKEAPIVARTRRLVTWAPSAAIGLYLLLPLAAVNDPIAGRPWTLAERLLTQPRVLVDYIGLIGVPRVLSTGVYNDAYMWSTSLVQPASTLPALLAVLALIVTGWGLRRRSTALAAAILFFFAGHLIESTTIPLELFFEHRNYLPAMLTFWPLALAIARWNVSPRLRTAIAGGALVLCAVMTWQRAGLWGDQPKMATLWAARSPDSSRAQATAAIFEVRTGHAESAVARLLPLWDKRPFDLQIALNAANAACAMGDLPPIASERVAGALRNSTDGDQLVHRWLDRAVDIAKAGSCRGLKLDTVDSWLKSAWSNPRLRDLPGRRQDLHSISGRLALLKGNGAEAQAAFDASLREDPKPQVAAQHAGLLATAGEYSRALAHLALQERLAAKERPAFGMPRIHSWVLAHQRYSEREIEALRAKLLEAERDHVTNP